MKESTIEKLEQLADNMDKMAEFNDLNGIVENDEEFHETIVKEADAKLLLDTWKSFEGKMLRHILLCIIQI